MTMTPTTYDRLTRLLSVTLRRHTSPRFGVWAATFSLKVSPTPVAGLRDRCSLCVSVAVRIVPKGPRQKRQHLRDLYTARGSFGDSGERLFLSDCLIDRLTAIRCQMT